jgi:hypothetical protein
VLTNLPFEGASDYLTVRSGTPRLRIRVTGTSTVLIDQDATVNAGRAYTVLATGLVASIAPLVLEDDLTDPAAGNARLRLVHAATLVGNVDVYLTAPTADIATESPTLSNLPYRTDSDYLEVPAGPYRVRITVAGSKLAAIDVNNLALAAGQIRTLVAVDAPGGGLPLGAILLADEN